jgi:hypothetical protein
MEWSDLVKLAWAICIGVVLVAVIITILMPNSIIEMKE